jgi:hydrogenase maturation protein HypF
VDTVVLSGGVFQNELLLSDLKALLESEQLEIWTNHAVPANDGGISLGQAALAALANWQSGGALEESDSASVAHRT